MGIQVNQARQQTTFAEEITTIKRVGVEFTGRSTGLDAWQRFFELCLQYAEVAKMRAAESAASVLSSDTQVSSTRSGTASPVL